MTKLLLPLMLAFGVTFGGEIKGTIHFAASVGHSDTPLKRYGYQPAGRAPANDPPAGVRAVVYIADTFPDSLFVPPDRRQFLDQRNEQFHPYLLPVVVGSTVEFPNNDRVFHNVFSFSKTKTFDLGKYPTNSSRSVTFDRTGIVSVYCEIHSHMNAFIIVLPNPWFYSVGEKGDFILKGLPGGTWTLSVFFGRGAQLTKRVTIRENEKLDIDFFQ